VYEHYYYNVNLDNKGNHEVHTDSCSFLPSPQNRVYIGYESSCSKAITRVMIETGKSNFDGCFWCCRECHIG
jgi:hypothetical protein